MNLFLSLLRSAILLGCTYTLVAISNCLFFSVLNMVVYCIGEISVFGAFTIIIAYIVMYNTGFAQTLSIPILILLLLGIAAIMCIILSMIAYHVSVKPFEHSSTLMPLLSTIALGVVIKETIGLGFKSAINAIEAPLTKIDNPLDVTSGRNPQAMPKLINASGTDQRDLIIIGATLLIVIMLFWFLNRTKTGLSMQAVSQNKDLTLMIGVNVKKIINITFILGGILMAIGGFLFGSYQSVVRFDTGTMYGSKGFAAAVVGGMKNIWGSIVGGMMMGFVEVFVSGLIPGGTKYQNIVAFAVAIMFMVFKPEGILGEKTIEKV